MKLFDKIKDKKKIGDNERDAKMSVMKHISDMAAGAMGDKLKGLKKVEVASDSQEGLEHGLEKAKDLLHAVPDKAQEDEESPDHEAHESEDEQDQEDLSGLDDDGEAGDEQEAEEHDDAEHSNGPEGHNYNPENHEHDSEHDGLSHEELDAKLEKLMKAKKKLDSKK